MESSIILTNDQIQHKTRRIAYQIFENNCNNETERYNFLKSFSKALIHLSELTTSKQSENFAEKPYIKTQGNMWLIF